MDLSTHIKELCLMKYTAEKVSRFVIHCKKIFATSIINQALTTRKIKAISINLQEKRKNKSKNDKGIK